MTDFSEEFERIFKDDDLGLNCRIWGHAPVQAEGTVGGDSFYFRSRHDEWTFSVSDSPLTDPVDIQFPDQGFFRESVYGNSFGSDASYMAYDEAEAIIRKYSREYVNERKSQP